MGALDAVQFEMLIRSTFARVNGQEDIDGDEIALGTILDDKKLVFGDDRTRKYNKPIPFLTLIHQCYIRDLISPAMQERRL